MRTSTCLLALPILATFACNGPAPAPTEHTEAQSAPVTVKRTDDTPTVARTAPPPLFNPFAQNDAAREGDVVPDPELNLASGKMQLLTPLRGRYVAIVFYGRDGTAEATAEMVGFREQWAGFEAAHVKVFGVSPDDAASHRQFTARLAIPFDLATDGDGKVAKSFGVPIEHGESAMVTYLIDPNGRIAKIWKNPTPGSQAREVLAAASL